MYQSLEIERHNQVATVWMNRPDVHNAFDETLIAELTAACEALDADASVRVVASYEAEPLDGCSVASSAPAPTVSRSVTGVEPLAAIAADANDSGVALADDTRKACGSVIAANGSACVVVTPAGFYHAWIVASPMSEPSWPGPDPAIHPSH